MLNPVPFHKQQAQQRERAQNAISGFGYDTGGGSCIRRAKVVVDSDVAWHILVCFVWIEGDVDLGGWGKSRI